MKDEMKRSMPLNLMVMAIHNLRCIANGSATPDMAEGWADELQAALIEADEAYRAAQPPSAALADHVPDVTKMVSMLTDEEIRQVCLHNSDSSIWGDAWRTFARAIESLINSKAAQGWQDIESAPGDGSDYLAYSKDDGFFVENCPHGYAAGRWTWDAAREQWRGRANGKNATLWHAIQPIDGIRAGGEVKNG